MTAGGYGEGAGLLTLRVAGSLDSLAIVGAS